MNRKIAHTLGVLSAISFLGNGDNYRLHEGYDFNEIIKEKMELDLVGDRLLWGNK